MFKLSTAVSLILSLAIFNHAQAADFTNRCGGYKVNSQRMDLTLNGRRITIVGWTHKTPGDKSGYTDPLDSAIDSAEGGNCKVASESLLTVVETYSKDVANNRKVLTEFKAISEDFSINFIGQELTYEQDAVARTSEENIDTALRFIQNKCGAETADATARYREMILDPPTAFLETANANIGLVPLEDSAIKAKSKTSVGETISNELFKDEMKLRQWKMINSDIVKIGKGESITEKRIQKVAAGSKTPMAKQKVENLLHAYNSLIENMKERDLAIVKNTQKLFGNGVILVGSAHLKDLAQGFISNCKTQGPQVQRKVVPHANPYQMEYGNK